MLLKSAATAKVNFWCLNWLKLLQNKYLLRDFSIFHKLLLTSGKFWQAKMLGNLISINLFSISSPTSTPKQSWKPAFLSRFKIHDDITCNMRSKATLNTFQDSKSPIHIPALIFLRLVGLLEKIPYMQKKQGKKEK